MQRLAFVMHIKEGCAAEYEKRHDEIWPELLVLLQNSGISNYNIFLHGLTLFAYLETDDPETLAAMKDHELTWKWWRYMEPLMECNEDSSPKIEPIPQVFHMD